MSIVALGLALLAAIGSADTRPPAPGTRLSAHLVRVVDGDTIRVDIDLGADVVLKNQAVRLLGIDAPELHGPERSRGAESKAALEKFLGVGAALAPPITVELHGKDKYGRWLADVFAGDENAALWMIRQRHARVYQIGRRGATLPVEAPASIERPAARPCI